MTEENVNTKLVIVNKKRGRVKMLTHPRLFVKYVLFSAVQLPRSC
jgi:hypothetical protein